MAKTYEDRLLELAAELARSIGRGDCTTNPYRQATQDAYKILAREVPVIATELSRSAHSGAYVRGQF